MDAIDLALLDFLQTRGRATHRDLAAQVGLSAPPTSDRIRKLEQIGLIRNYAALLDPEKVGLGIAAFVHVSMADTSAEAGFVSSMMECDSILECHHVTGEFDFILKVRTESTAALEKLVTQVIRRAGGVARTRTCVIFSSPKEDTRLPLAQVLKELERTQK